jgi:hypothetical protein
LARVTARELRSAENEWSAIGAWKRWWTSGEAILDRSDRRGDRSTVTVLLVLLRCLWEIVVECLEDVSMVGSLG